MWAILEIIVSRSHHGFSKFASRVYCVYISLTDWLTISINYLQIRIIIVSSMVSEIVIKIVLNLFNQLLIALCRTDHKLLAVTIQEV